MSRSRTFRLRRRHFNDKPVTAVSGGNHLPRPWPETVQVGRAAPNLQLIADPIANRHDVTHHRSSVAATFVPSDTTRAHFEHSRAVFLRMGVPAALHANGLALFGHEATAEGRDPKSESQRALTTLGVSHLVAPTHQARVKIERRFGTLQGRIVTLLGHEKVQSFGRRSPSPMLYGLAWAVVV